MSIPGAGNPLLLGGAAGGYEIERSLRFNSADSAYLSRTPASAGNRKTWTWSGWVKRTSLGSRQLIFGNLAASLGFSVEFIADDSLDIYDYSSNYQARRNTTQVFRDCSAWYHIVIVYDSANATAADRLRLYVNGARVTAFANSTDPTLNADGVFNTAVETSIGRSGTFNLFYFNGYLADIHFIDGQALDSTSFGEFDDNGVWQPIAYAGTYGTNGFHLDFSDNSTAAALGTDTSGNGNTWTVNNISVAAGADNDSLADSPTNGSQTDTGVGGEVVGNYCTWNPLDKDADVTLTNGNLDMTQTAPGGVKGTIHVSSGKWYWEIAKTTTANQCYGIATSAAIPSTYVGGYVGSAGVASNGTLYSNGNFTKVNGTATIGPFSSGDIIGLELDLDSSPKTLKFYRNGTLETANHYEITETGPLTPVVGTNVGDYVAPGSANFGQRPFAYTAPSGFKALCTTNLPDPDPAIADGSKAMDVKLWTGNSSTQTISGLGFSPDFVWIKSRNNAYNHNLADTVRGAGKALFSNLTSNEFNQVNYITAFNSDGFDLGNHSTVNQTGATYVAWTWDAGSSTVTNTDGTITSQVRANPSAGFSVVTYTGNGTAGSTIGHGLGAAPSLVICKSRSNTGTNWGVYHKSTGATHYLYLNSTAAAAAASVIWNDTPPSSTVFTVGTNTGVNQNTYTYVAYCFAPVEGYSAFGSYTGNGSADGPFVYTGFRPRWILYKASSAAQGWAIHDTSRSEYNTFVASLYPNLADAEYNGAGHEVDILSNGFKPRNTNSRFNSSGTTYIYAAFAEHPFALARAR